MCGLVGICSVDPVLNRQWLRIAGDRIGHRGPDDYGEWWSDDRRVGLAHRRLAIQDLSSAGHQPMHLKEKGLSIVFNGEIYNFHELREELKGLGYSFNSGSDTEILLVAYAAWGIDCVNKLIGMFAFALLDEVQKQLLLARDRAGEKPLFYKVDSGVIYFASELKALLANPILPRKINLEALDCYLAMGYVPGDRCILDGYAKLPPASVLTFNLCSDSVKVWEYWDLPEYKGKVEPEQEFDLEVQIERLLEDAVGRQLIADVPVGVLLSGGVDSSLVTAMAVRRRGTVHTFSVGFPGHGVYDETDHARLIARYFSTEHTELVAEPASADLIPLLSSQFDEPVADSSMIPTWLVCNLVKPHCTVALGGDGGDELFGGYPMHQRLMVLQRYAGLIPLPLRKGIGDVSRRYIPTGVKGKGFLESLGVDLRSEIPFFQEFFGARLRNMLIPELGDVGLKAEGIRELRFPACLDLMQRATRFDFKNYLTEDILVKVDRTSMLNSIEIRNPFLDHRLIEFAFSRVPSVKKATVSGKKLVLKRLAERILPPKFDRQRKQGFSIPLNSWLEKGPYRDLVWDTLTRADCCFDRQMVRRILEGQDRGFKNGQRLFSLVLFELWRQEYRIEL